MLSSSAVRVFYAEFRNPELRNPDVRMSGSIWPVVRDGLLALHQSTRSGFTRILVQRTGHGPVGDNAGSAAQPAINRSRQIAVTPEDPHPWSCDAAPCWRLRGEPRRADTKPVVSKLIDAVALRPPPVARSSLKLSGDVELLCRSSCEGARSA
jgi:hypothetical protein